MFVLTVKPLGCKITRNIADVLAFAEYRQSMFWPNGTVIKIRLAIMANVLLKTNQQCCI